MHLIPIGRRAGSRAGLRSITRAASRIEPFGSVMAGVCDLMRSDVSGSCDAATEGFERGTLLECIGESMVVSGVPTEAAADIREAPGAGAEDGSADGRAELLNTEETVLAWELADPIPLGVSPKGDSLSSV